MENETRLTYAGFASAYPEIIAQGLTRAQIEKDNEHFNGELRFELPRDPEPCDAEFGGYTRLVIVWGGDWCAAYHYHPETKWELGAN